MKLDRLLAITMTLLNQTRVSANELAERFEVSLRTIYRDMDSINLAGIPIVSFAGSEGGYEIMSGYRLDNKSCPSMTFPLYVQHYAEPVLQRTIQISMGCWRE